MAKKYYAVKQGVKTGIFTTWDECKQNVHGYPGAEYKSFTSRADAENYLKDSYETDVEKNGTETVSESEVVAYVDGSFNEESSEFSFGAVVFYQGEQMHFAEKFNDPDLVSMRNVAGEIKGSEKAMAFAIDKGAKSLTIHHDYEGIAKWCTSEWQAKKPGTIAYKKYFDGIKKSVDIKFVKVKSHSGDEFNDLADKLAKEAFVQQKPMIDVESNASDKTKNIGIYVDSKELEEVICSAGLSEWDDFKFISLEKAGKAKRCIFSAGDKQCSLDFYSKNNGTTTMTPVGKNSKFSARLREIIIEQSEFKDTGVSKSHTFRISKDWSYKLADFIKDLGEIELKHSVRDNPPKHESFKFVSSRGDRLSINVYETGNVVLQGKPAYLYTEALSFLSYCPQISIRDVLEANNTFHEVDMKVEDARAELQKLMPKTYNEIDDTLIKILSPSVCLKKVGLELEDYSCYAFPALRALEGYLKQLFSIEDIEIGHKYGKYYRYIKKKDVYTLKKTTVDELSNSKSKDALEEVYNYFFKNRHTLFHAEQILFTSRILEDKQEADLIVNEVIEMIERTYTHLTA